MSCTQVMVRRACSTLCLVLPVMLIAVFVAVAMCPVSATAQDVWGPEDDPYVPEERGDLSSSTSDDGDSQKDAAGIPQTVDSLNISSLDPSNFPEICTYVEVLDENGDPIPHLDLDSFCVFQDSTKIDSFSVVELQQDCNTSIALVLDVSGSMRTSGKIDSLKSAAHQFVNQMDVNDRVALVKFASCYSIVQGFTSNQALLHAKIDSLNANGRTAALDGIWQGVDLTKSEIGSKAVIAISDGMENNSGECPGFSDGLLNGFTNDSIAITGLANSSGVPIYTIALGGLFDPQYLKGLAYGSGGDYYYAPSGADIINIYTEIKFRVCSRYFICYTSPDTLNNGDCHTVRICRLDPSGFCQPCDTATFCEPTPPRISVDFACQRWDQDMWFCADVTDSDTPAESLQVKLFYRNDNGAFNEAVLALQPSGQFCTTILKSFFPCGGDPVEFYITAFDGITAASYPAGAPGQTDFVEVCPNSPPECRVPNDTIISLCDTGQVCLPVSCYDADGNLSDGYPDIQGPGSYSNGNWCYTPSGDEEFSVLVTCVDSCGEGCEREFRVRFEVNEPPTCGWTQKDTTIFQCQPTQTCFNYLQGDPDGNLDSCRITMDDGTKIIPDGNTWCYTPKGDETVTFTIRCWDSCGELCEKTLTVTYEINEGPLCDVPNDTTIFQCQPAQVCWPHFPTDPDGNLLTCRYWVIGDDPKSVESDIICITPKESGPVSIVVYCEDECGEVCEDTFTVNFVLNEAPNCGRAYDTTIALCASERICLPVSCDDENLMFGPQLLNSGSGIVGEIIDGNWCYTPTQNETVDLWYRCMDSCSVACTTFSVIDIVVNQKPVCNMPNDTSIFLCESQEVCFNYSYNDPDGNLDSCRLMPLGDPTSAKGPGGVLCITPTTDTTYRYVLECWDLCGEYCADTFTVRFDLNDDPMCNLPNDTTYILCQPGVVCINYFPTDADDNLVTCEQWTSKNPDKSTKSDPQGYGWCYDATTTETVIFYAQCYDECQATCYDSVVVNFVVNEGPRCSGGFDTTVTLCAPEPICLPFECIDGNLESGPTVISGPGSITNGMWCYTPAGDETIDLLVECIDSCGVACTTSSVIDVDINEPPVCTTLVLSPPLCLPDTHFVPILTIDPDGDPTNCSNTNPDATIENGVWMYANPLPGQTVVDTVICADTCLAACTLVVNFTYPTPQPPICNLPSDTTINLCALDAGGFCFPVSATGGAECRVVEGPGTVSNGQWCFDPAGPGPYDVTIECATECDTCSGSFTVTIDLNEPPEINCLVNDPVTEGSSEAGFPESRCFSFCELDSIWLDYSAFDPDGDSLVIFSNIGVVDSAMVHFLPDTAGFYTWIIGAIDECQVTVVDTCYFCVEINQPPVITCPPDERHPCGEQVCTYGGVPRVVDEDTATVVVEPTYDTIPGDCPQNWTLTITWIATDSCGLADTCVQNIFHFDDTPPEILCDDCCNECDDCKGCDQAPGHSVIDHSHESKGTGVGCEAIGVCGNCTIYFDSVTYDNGAGTSSWYYNAVWDGSAPSPSHVTLGVCNFLADSNIIESNPPYSSIGNDGSTSLFGIKWEDSTLMANWPVNTPYPFSFTLDRQFEVEEVGVIVKAGPKRDTTTMCGVSCRERDGCIRVISCDEALVLQPPLFRDNCDPEPVIRVFRRDSIPGDCPQNYGLVIVWEAEDACGNKSYCERHYRVIDDTPPEITCPADTTISCTETNKDGESFGPGRPLGDPIVTDNCDPNPLWESDFEILSDDPCSTVWKFSFWAWDACKNVSDTCYQIVTVVDTSAPEIICPADTVIACDAWLVEPEPGAAIPQWPFGEPEIRDDCDPNPMKAMVSRLEVNSDPCSLVVKIGYLAWDRCGNYSDTCFQYVTVVDTVAPQVFCPRDTTIDCMLEINGQFAWATAEDNCDDEPRVDLVLQDTVFADIGQGCDYTVRRWFTATDTCGNTSERCFQAITVIDTTGPVCSLPADTSFFICEPGTELCLPVSAEDRCDSDVECRVVDSYGTIANGQWCFAPDTSGVYGVIVVCEDDCGNQCRGEFNVSVRVNRPPTVVGPPDTSFFLCEPTRICVGPFEEFDLDGNQDRNFVNFGVIDPPFVCFEPDTAGVYEIICCTVDSCEVVTCDTVYVTVRFNSIPMCHPPNDTTIFLCDIAQVCLPYSCSDADGNLLKTESDKGELEVKNDTMYWCYVPKGNETLQLTVRCIDSCGAECAEKFRVTFVINEDPICNVPDDTTIYLCDTNEVMLPISGTDPDGNFFGCEIYEGPGELLNGHWVYTPNGEQSTSVVIACYDSCEASCYDTLTVTWEYNLPPVCEFDELVPPICIPDTLFLPINSFDPEQGPVTCEVVEGVGFITDMLWKWEPVPGTDTTVVIRCTDTCGAYCELPFRVVIPDPQPPVCVVPVGDQEFFFCEPEQICLPVKGISGVEEGGTTCEVISGPGSITDSMWCYTPNGSESFDVTVRCTDICGTECEATFHVEVVMNTAPECDIPGDRQFFQCSPTTVQIPFTVSDIDKNFSHCEVFSGPGEILGSNWVYTPSGSETAVVTIRCWDDCETYCEGSFEVRFDIDEDPICVLPNDTTIAQCQPTRVFLPIGANFFEPNDDAGSDIGNPGGGGSNDLPTNKKNERRKGTTYGKQTYDRNDRGGNLAAGGEGDAFCEIISGPGELVDGDWVYTPSGDEDVTVVIRCTDRCGFTCEGDFRVVFEVNEAPECDFQEPGPVQCIPPVVVVPFTSTDPDGDPVDCELVEGQGSLGDGFWTYNPVGGESFDVLIRCTDTCGAFCEISFTYTAPNPQPPICVLPTEDIELFLCSPQTITAGVSSIGGEGQVTCEVTDGPGSISNGQWSYFVTQTGTFEVFVECTDICGNSCQGSFFVDVTINSDPTCNVPDDQNYWTCDEVDISLPISGADVDGNLTGCEVASGPGQIVNGQYVWTADTDGEYDITIRCYDECEAYCEETFTITVDVNEAPICQIEDPYITGCDQARAEIPLNVTDDDGNLSRCKILTGPGTIVDGNWVYNSNISGDFPVTIECIDSCGAKCISEFTAHFDLNTPPTCLFGDTTITVCGPSDVHFPLPVFDPDGNFAGCELISGPGSIVGNEWVYHLLEDLPIDLVIRCYDDCETYCEKSFRIYVEFGDVNTCEFIIEENVVICGPGEFCLDIPPGCNLSIGQGAKQDGVDLCFLATEEGRYWAVIECEDDCGSVCSDTAFFNVVFDGNLPDCGPLAGDKPSARGAVQTAGADCGCPARGDIDGDGEINSTDLSLLSRFLSKEVLQFQGTPGCPLYSRADVNCDGRVDMDDIDDLQNYLFFGGAIPCSDCTDE